MQDCNSLPGAEIFGAVNCEESRLGLGIDPELEPTVRARAVCVQYRTIRWISGLCEGEDDETTTDETFHAPKVAREDRSAIKNCTTTTKQIAEE